MMDTQICEVGYHGSYVRNVADWLTETRISASNLSNVRPRVVAGEASATNIVGLEEDLFSAGDIEGPSWVGDVHLASEYVW